MRVWLLAGLKGEKLMMTVKSDQHLEFESVKLADPSSTSYRPPGRHGNGRPRGGYSTLFTKSIGRSTAGGIYPSSANFQ